jgi:hypothetical protein
MPPLDPDDRLLRRLRGAPGADLDVGDPDATDIDEVAFDEVAFDDALLGRINRAVLGLQQDDETAGDVQQPSAELWDRIASAVASSAGRQPGTSGGDDAAGDAEPDAGGSGGSGGSATVTDLADLAGRRGGRTGPRRSGGGRAPFRGGRWLAAAAAVVVVAGAGVFAAGRGERVDIVAEVALQPLEGEGSGSGSARLIELPDGRRQLVVDETLASVPAESYVEVWLIDPESDLQRMVSLGPVDGRRTLEIPRGIDPSTYRVVDVSIEPADGDPTHSGRSVLRGTIPV